MTALVLNGTVGNTVVTGDDALIQSVAGTMTYVADGTDGTAIEGYQTPYCNVAVDVTSGWSNLYVSTYAAAMTLGVNTWFNNIGATASDAQAQVRMNTSNQLAIRNKTVTVGTSTLTLTAGQWCRFDWTLTPGSSTQTLGIFTGANLHGSTANETLSGAYTPTGTVDTLLAGTPQAGTGTMRVNRMAWDTTAMPAPYGTPPSSLPLYVNVGGVEKTAATTVVIGGVEKAATLYIVQSGVEIPL